MAFGSSSSRESRSLRRRSVDTEVPLAGLFRVRTVEEGDLGPLEAQVAIKQVFREPGADDRVGLECPDGLFERVWKRTKVQALLFFLVEFGGIPLHQMRLREVFLDPAQTGEYEHGEGQVWAGRRIGGAELQVELAGRVTLRERRDADGGLPVTLAHVTKTRTPVVGTQAQVGDYARRGERAEGGQMLEDAGGEAGRGGAQTAWPLGVVGYRSSLLIYEAHVDVDAVADALRVAHRREARPVAEPAGHLANDLPRGGGPVRRHQTTGRRAGDLELPLAVFWQEDLRLEAGLPQGGHHQRPERFDEPLGLERETRPGLESRAAQQELVLEGGDKAQPCLPLEPGERVLQERTRAGIPGAPVGVGRVAEEEVQGRDVIPEIHPCPGRPVGQEPQIPDRAPRVGLGDGPEGRERLVGRHPPHPRFEARLELRGQDRPPPVQPREVAVEKTDELLAPHGPHPAPSGEPLSQCRTQRPASPSRPERAPAADASQAQSTPPSCPSPRSSAAATAAAGCKW